MKLTSNRFGFEPEFTANVAKGRWRIYEVPISYDHAGTRAEKRSAGATGLTPCG